jgi:Flp pilus assembly protein TadD
MRTMPRLALVGVLLLLAGCDRSSRSDSRDVPTRVTGPLPTAADVPAPRLEGMEPRVRAIIVDKRREVLENLGRGDAWGRFGMVLHAHEVGEDARHAYRVAHELAPYDFRWAYLLAEVLHEQGLDQVDLEAVESAYRTAEELDPEYAPLHVRLGEVRTQRGDYAGARDAYSHALELDPTIITARCGLARSLLTLGESERALDVIRTAAQERPDDWEVQMILARAWGKMGDREKARAAADRARTLPQAIEFRDPVAATVMNYAVSATACFKRAEALYNDGNYPDALLNLRVVAEVRPDHGAVQERIGWCQLRLDRPEAAAASFRRALSLDDSLRQAHAGLAMALEQLGETEEARRHQLLAQGGAGDDAR